MITKLVIASLLAGPSVAASGEAAARTAGASAAYWPHMHQCAVHPKATAKWSRIDLNVAASPGGNAGPTIVAHAINTKGTGAAGRSELAIKTKGTGAQRQTNTGHAITPIGIDCVKSVVAGDEATQKSAAASFAFMQAGDQGLGWSCSVSGNEEQPTFRVGLFVPAALAQTGASRADWSWGATNSGSRVSILPHSAETSGSWHVACASKEPRKTTYDLAVIKKP